MNFAKKLISWYLENKRNLPWRATKDPYEIWLSEIILQQTRVEQGKPYYFKFLETYPDVFSLANASEEEVLKLWQGLGYYSRARNLHFTAKHVVNEFNGRFPDTYKDLLKLKGVGDYTASAIASVCFDEPQAAVDGNVFRVLGRIFGIDTPTNTGAGIKEFKALGQDLIDKDDPGSFNQAVIEFGSEQCKPRQPLCNSCIFSEHCIAFNERRIETLPVKLKNLKIKKRHFNYLVFLSDEKKTLFQQRRGKGIWEGLYEFPLIETATEATAEQLVKEPDLENYGIEQENLTLYNDHPILHKLTHQHINAKFWIIDCEELPEKGIYYEQINKYPMPVLIGNFIDTFEF